jgi:N-acetylneuraminic acid mutarotase
MSGRAGRSIALALLGALAALGCDGTTGPPGARSSPDAGAPPPSGPGRWETLDPMTGTPRFYVGVAAVGKKVFVVGGTSQTVPTAPLEVDAYDTVTGTWERIEALPERFQMPNVAGVGGKLFVLGAVDVTTTMAYDVATRTWSRRAPMPVDRGRGQAAVGVWGKKIIVAGGVIPGRSGNDLATGMRKSEVLSYDTEADEWETLPELALTRGYCMGAVLGDQFWVMGGSSDFVRTDDVTMLDLQTRTWEDQPALPITLSSAGVSVLNGRVYVLGGIATGTGTIGPATLYLDPASKTFGEAEVMLTPRFGMGAATVDGRIYVPAGIAAVGENRFAAVPTFEVFIP